MNGDTSADCPTVTCWESGAGIGLDGTGRAVERFGPVMLPPLLLVLTPFMPLLTLRATSSRVEDNAVVLVLIPNRFCELETNALEWGVMSAHSARILL